VPIRVHAWFQKNQRRYGFTLIELTVALALATILMGLVIVRMSWGSPRQQAVSEARKLGNLIRTFRERAQFEEREYALRLDLVENGFEILPLNDRSPEALGMARAIRQGRLPERVRIEVLQGERELSSPAVLFFTRHGVLPETTITLSYASDLNVSLRPNPLTNEVAYAED